MDRSSWRIALLVAGVLIMTLVLAACAPRRAAAPAAQEGPSESVADFYRGKTITVIVGFGPGGGFDTTARVLAKHMGKHIPGNPNIIVENMDGAASLIAANHLYKVARPDGLTFGTFNEQQVLNQATGMPGVEFDARRFSWLGNAVQSTTACTIRSDTPYNTADDLMRRDLPPLILGGTGPGANTDDFAKLLREVIGANVRLVSGYSGTRDIRLAVDSGEVQGLCWSWESVMATAKPWLDSNFIRVPIYQRPQVDERILALFPTAKRLEDLTSDESAKQIIRASAAPGALSKPFVAPPGVPAARLKALQDAFWTTMKDPEFLVDVEQARLDLDPNPASEAEQLVNQILGLRPELVARLAEIRR